MRNVPFFPAACLLFAFPFLAHATDMKNASTLVASASHGRFKAASVFAGPSGLEGIVIVPSAATTPASGLHILGGGKQVAWMTKDGRHLLVGALFDEKGADEGYAAMRRLGLVSKPLSAMQMYRRTVQAHGFNAGVSGPIIHIYFDPNCVVCNRLYKRVEPMVRSRKLRIRWIPVAILPHDSLGRAVAILSADNPAAVLAENEEKFDHEREIGGVAPIKNMRQKYVDDVISNTGVLAAGSEHGAGTPTIVYQSDHGPVVSYGMPASLSGLLHNLRGWNTLSANR